LWQPLLVVALLVCSFPSQAGQPVIVRSILISIIIILHSIVEIRIDRYCRSFLAAYRHTSASQVRPRPSPIGVWTQDRMLQIRLQSISHSYRHAFYTFKYARPASTDIKLLVHSYTTHYASSISRRAAHSVFYAYIDHDLPV